MASFAAREAWPLHDLAFRDSLTPEYILDTVIINNSLTGDTIIP
jgi:hypothetical protein